MKEELKIVEFDIYCPTCQYLTLSEEDAPCDECLTFTARPNSHKPEYWKEKEK